MTNLYEIIKHINVTFGTNTFSAFIQRKNPTSRKQLATEMHFERYAL